LAQGWVGTQGRCREIIISCSKLVCFMSDFCDYLQDGVLLLVFVP
jgi:hypothetical protein